MTKFSLATKSLLILAVGGVLPGCEYLGFAQEYAAKGAAEAARAECSLGSVIRTQNYCAIQDELARMQTPARVSPLDCDGNGMPDDLGTCGGGLPE